MFRAVISAPMTYHDWGYLWFVSSLSLPHLAPRNIAEEWGPQLPRGESLKYRTFHNVLRDYKHLLQETLRTRIYQFFLGGICQRPGIRPTTATWPRWPKDTDHCSSEEYRCAHVDACVARTWISYRCVPCHPWCTHRTSIVVKKKLFQFFSFPVAVNNPIKIGPLVFLW
jgi:hypothetical protein